MGNLTIDVMLAAKRELEAGAPPPMLAIRCHPATEPLIRRAFAAMPPDSLGSFLTPRYHGWLTVGILSDDIEGRRYE